MINTGLFSDIGALILNGDQLNYASSSRCQVLFSLPCGFGRVLVGNRLYFCNPNCAGFGLSSVICQWHLLHECQCCSNTASAVQQHYIPHRSRPEASRLPAKSLQVQLSWLLAVCLPDFNFFLPVTLLFCSLLLIPAAWCFLLRLHSTPSPLRMRSRTSPCNHRRPRFSPASTRV